MLTAHDVVESHHDCLVIDVTCDATDAEHAEAITRAISNNSEKMMVRNVSDRTLNTSEMQVQISSCRTVAL